MVTTQSIQLGVTVARNTVGKLADIIVYADTARLNRAQRAGIDAYTLHMLRSLSLVLARTEERVAELEAAERDSFKRSEPENLPF